MNLIKKSKNKNTLKILITGNPRTGSSLFTEVFKILYDYKTDNYLTEPKNLNPNKLIKGYNESQKLMKLSDIFLKKNGGNFKDKIPKNTSIEGRSILKKIKKYVEKNNIEIIKENRFMVFIDEIIKTLKPEKLIFLERDIDLIYKSVFGGNKNYNDFLKSYKKRRDKWDNSKAKNDAIVLNLEDLRRNPNSYIDYIIKKINIKVDNLNEKKKKINKVIIK